MVNPQLHHVHMAAVTSTSNCVRPLLLLALFGSAPLLCFCLMHSAARYGLWELCLVHSIVRYEVKGVGYIELNG